MERQNRNKQLAAPAIELLRENRRASAAALFEPLLEKDWDDGQLYNNYAFCKLPDDPARALDALQHAVSVGDGSCINLANRVLVLFWLGRAASALELAGQVIDRWADFKVESCYLWDYRSSREETIMKHYACAKCYVVELGYFVACSIDEDLVARKWRAHVKRHVPCHQV